MDEISLLEKAKQILTDFLIANNMRKTPERYAILENVFNMTGHKSADDIWESMNESFHVSKGTVYSSLKLFEDLNFVVSHNLRGITLYELAYGSRPHHHYICKGCGKMWDFNDSDIDVTVKKAKLPRFKKMVSTVYIYGLCNVCQVKLARLKKRMEQNKVQSMTREEKRFAQIGEELAEAAKWIK